MSRSENPSVNRSRTMSGSTKRLLFIGIPLAAGAGVLMALIQSRPAQASTPKTRNQVFMAEIQPGASLQPRPGAPIAEPERPQRFAMWSQAVYEDEIDQGTVEALIATDRAEALEGRLRLELREDLRKHLFDIDQQIIQIGWQSHDEFQRVAALLRERDGLVVIRTHPREKDPRWPEVQAMMKRLNQKEGLVHASYQRSLAPSGWKGKPSEEPLAYVFAAFKEWPIWHRYKEKYDLALYQRILQSRRWIAAEYGKRGMSIFQD